MSRVVNKSTKDYRRLPVDTGVFAVNLIVKEEVEQQVEQIQDVTRWCLPMFDYILVIRSYIKLSLSTSDHAVATRRHKH